MLKKNNNKARISNTGKFISLDDSARIFCHCCHCYEVFLVLQLFSLQSWLACPCSYYSLADELLKKNEKCNSWVELIENNRMWFIPSVGALAKEIS